MKNIYDIETNEAGEPREQEFFSLLAAADTDSPSSSSSSSKDEKHKTGAAGGDDSGTPKSSAPEKAYQAEKSAAEKTDREDKKVDSHKDDKKPKAKPEITASRKSANHLREYRIEQMISKAELARKAGLSVLTIDRIEKGFGCRMDTARKILKALGFKLSDRRKVFGDE
jgi:DNA-binding XRE family transcriptional regulator